MIQNFNEWNHELFMKEALREAEEAGKRGDRAIGAVIVHEGKVIAKGSNRIVTMDSRIAHAEIAALHSCASFLKQHGPQCVIYTTLEPCVMCVTSIVMANIRNIVFAVEDGYMDVENLIASNTYLKERVHNYVGGVLEEKSLVLLGMYSPELLQMINKHKE